MFVRLRPAQVVEAYLRHAVLLVELKAHARFLPVLLRVCQPEFKLDVRHTARNDRAPLVARVEAEFVLLPFLRLARRTLCPPGVEACWRGNGLKDLAPRRLDLKVMKDVSHDSLPYSLNPAAFSTFLGGLFHLRSPSWSNCVFSHLQT